MFRFTCTRPVGHLDDHTGVVSWTNKEPVAEQIRRAAPDERAEVAARLLPGVPAEAAIAEALRGTPRSASELGQRRF